jgi:hypothetical protein
MTILRLERGHPSKPHRIFFVEKSRTLGARCYKYMCLKAGLVIENKVCRYETGVYAHVILNITRSLDQAGRLHRDVTKQRHGAACESVGLCEALIDPKASNLNQNVTYP